MLNITWNYALVVIKNPQFSTNGYSKHSQFKPQCYDMFYTCLQCYKLTPKRAWLNSCLSLAIPDYWGAVNEYYIPCMRFYFLLIRFMGYIDKFSNLYCWAGPVLARTLVDIRPSFVGARLKMEELTLYMRYQYSLYIKLIHVMVTYNRYCIFLLSWRRTQN